MPLLMKKTFRFNNSVQAAFIISSNYLCSSSTVDGGQSKGVHSVTVANQQLFYDPGKNWR